MRDEDLTRRRIVSALVLALIAGAMVYVANPVKTLKADVRADAKGFVLSIEYGANLVRKAPISFAAPEH